MGDIQACTDFINAQFDVYQSDLSVTVLTTPAKALSDQNEIYHLYAQSTTSADQTVNLALPTFKNFLRTLASQGVGYTDEFRGIKFRYVKCMFYYPPFIYPSLKFVQWTSTAALRPQSLTCRFERNF
jgi:hypothetical protein